MVLTVYEGTSSFSDHIEYHPVKNGIIQSARQFSYEFLRETLEGYKILRKPPKKKQNVKIVGAIPKNLLFLDNNGKNTQIIFYDEQQERVLLCNNQNKIKSNRKYKIPGIIYLQDGLRLRLFAFQEFNEGNTILYHLRLPNIDKSGYICMGNVKRQVKGEVKEVMNEIRVSLWNSYFAEWRYGCYDKMWQRNQFTFGKKYQVGTLKEIAHETFRTTNIYE